MAFKHIYKLLALAALAISPMSQGANRDLPQQIQFQKNRTSTVIHGSVSAWHTKDYQLTARKGQHMSIDFYPTHTTMLFTVIAPENGAFLRNAMLEESNTFSLRLPQSGKYTVRVFQVGNAKTQKTPHSFRLKIAINDGVSQANQKADRQTSEHPDG